MSNPRIPASDEAWDERLLGAEEAYAKVAPQELTEGIDEASGMQAISIRLPKALIEDFKLIASWNKDIGYQPLMRQILQRFADSEKRRIVADALAERAMSEEPLVKAEVVSGGVSPKKARPAKKAA